MGSSHWRSNALAKTLLCQRGNSRACFSLPSCIMSCSSAEEKIGRQKVEQLLLPRRAVAQDELLSRHMMGLWLGCERC